MFFETNYMEQDSGIVILILTFIFIFIFNLFK